METTDLIYYTYIYLNPLKQGKFIYENLEFEYEPFYVGRGFGDRSLKHIWIAKKHPSKGNRHKSNIINKIIRSGNEPIIYYVKDLDFDTSIEFEIRYIKNIGRNDKNLGPLTNMTDGGEGTINKTITDETKKKLSNSAKLRIGDKNPRWKCEVTNETREKIRKSQIGKKYSDEVNKTKGLSGEKNPMAGRSFYDVWLSKYGKEIADIKLEEFKEKCRKRFNKNKNGKSI